MFTLNVNMDKATKRVHYFCDSLSEITDYLHVQLLNFKAVVWETSPLFYTGIITKRLWLANKENCAHCFYLQIHFRTFVLFRVLFILYYDYTGTQVAQCILEHRKHDCFTILNMWILLKKKKNQAYF